jgi:hypothetical protein
MKLRPLLTLSAALLALCPALATAQTSAVPGFISYQGRVVNAAGINVGKDAPVNRTVIFRIWDSPSSTNTANLIYSESQTVTVSDGEFSVLVGQGVANTTQTFGYSEAGTDKKLADFSAAFNGSPGSARYLGVTVADASTIAPTDNEITPRQQIVSTAFAMRAKFAENVSGTVSLAKDTDFILNPGTLPAGSVASNYGLGWYGSGRLFNGTAMDGPVLYGNSGGALGSNASGTQKTALRWDASGRVGIGAASIESATNKLTLQGDMTTTPGDQLTIRGNTDNNKRLSLGYDTTANKATLQSYTAAATAGPLLLNPSGGNVGIGSATAPAYALDVTGAINASTNLTTGGYVLGGSSIRATTNIIANGANGHTFGVTGDTDGGLFSPEDGIVTIRTNNVERLRVDSSGNFGINNSAPATALEVGNYNKSSDSFIRVATAGGNLYRAGIDFRHFNTSIGYSIYSDERGSGNYGLHFARVSDGVSSTKMFMSDAGNVGIGTTAPAQAKLVVIGSVFNHPGTTGQKTYYNRLGWYSQSNSDAQNVGIYADQGIWTNSQVFVSSDKRIKNIEGVSNGQEDLSALLGIEITNYRMKDAVSNDQKLHKKVIAQQVEQFYPLAVSKQTGVVPDVFEKAKINGAWISLASDLKKGDRVKLVTQVKGGTEEKEGIHEVLEVADGKFRTDFKSDGEVFVYGREVKDFRNVDYDAIAMLNVSATQELKREKDTEIQALRDENATLRRELAAKDASLEARLIALEHQRPDGGGTATVSLKTVPSPR